MSKNSALLIAGLLFASWIGASPAGSIAAPAFHITYGDDTYLGVFLGFDEDEYHPICMGFASKVLDINGDGFEDIVFGTNARANQQINPLPLKVFLSNGKTLIDKTSILFAAHSGNISPAEQCSHTVHVRA